MMSRAIFPAMPPKLFGGANGWPSMAIAVREPAWGQPSLTSPFGGIEQRGHFEQEATEGTELELVLCFLRYLLLNSEDAAFCADDADFFSCVSRLSRLDFRRSGRAGRHCEFVRVGWRFLRLCQHDVAEPTGCSEPRDRVGVATRTSLARGRRSGTFGLSSR